MKYEYIKYIFLVLIFIYFYSCTIFADENGTEFGITYGYIEEDHFFNEWLVNTSEYETSYFTFIPTGIFVILNSGLFFYNFIIESFLTDIGSSSGKTYMYFFESGTGMQLSLFNFVKIRASINLGTGFYLLKMFSSHYSENYSVIRKDVFVYAEPDIMAGIKLANDFSFYIGINTKFIYFFSKNLSNFNSIQYYLMFCYYL